MIRRSIPSLILAGLLFAPTAVRAGQINQSGTFVGDDSVAWVGFTVPVPGAVSIRTLSYAAGGFDPVLSVFDLAGLQPLLAWNEDAPGVCGVDNAADSSTDLCLDSALSMLLAAGNYSLAITQSFNYPLGPFLSDGFLMDGTGNFTGGPFIDVIGSQRTGDWAVQLQLPDGPGGAPVPEPGSLWLYSAAVAAWGGVVKTIRRHRNQFRRNQ